DPGRSFFAVDPHYSGPKRFSLAGFFSAARSPYSQEDFQYPTTVAGVDGHTYLYLDENEKEHVPESVERLPVEWGSDLVSLASNRGCSELRRTPAVWGNTAGGIARGDGGAGPPRMASRERGVCHK